MSGVSAFLSQRRTRVAQWVR